MNIKNRKKKNFFITISVIIFIYILSLTIGYSFFSESLTVNGVASTVEYYSGTTLPAEPVILDTTQNRYSTESIHKDFVDWSSETWGTDTFEVHYQKKWGITIGTKTITYNVALKNPTVLDNTEATITSSITKNDSGGVKSTTATLSSTTVGPGETLTIGTTVTHNFLTRLNSDAVTTIVTYNLQGKPRTFTIIVYFDAA